MNDAAREAFERTGGDLRAVVRSILLANEFYDPTHQHAKIRTPLEYTAAALRAANANVGVGVSAARLVRDLGQAIFDEYGSAARLEQGQQFIQHRLEAVLLAATDKADCLE